MSRTYKESNYESDDNSNTDHINLKRSKVMELNYDDMIYALGTQIHFTSCVASHTIEKLIMVFTQVISNNIPKFGTRLDEGQYIDIDYIVDSPGGSVTDVLKFVDFLNMAKEKHPYFRFNSIITGRAASAGTIMSVVAHRRYITKNAFAMIHELAAGINGKYSDMKSQISLYEKMHRRLLDIYIDGNSKLSESKLEELLKLDSWFTAQEYKDLGFVDGIRGEDDCVVVN